MNRSNTGNIRKGFSLMELLVAVAIVGVLAAVAIPQFYRFRAKAARTEALLTLNGAHKAEMAYYSGADHFLLGCTPPAASTCSPAGPALITFLDNMGLSYLPAGFLATTPHGYMYGATFLDSPTANYEVNLFGDLDPYDPSGMLGAGLDVLLIGVNIARQQPFSVAAFAAMNGIPYIYTDGITHQFRCPC